MTALLLTRSQVQALLDARSLIDPLRAGFVAYSATVGGRARRTQAALPGPGTATVLFPGTAPGVPGYTVKVHAKFPAEDPAIRGILCLHDLTSGKLLAVMDSTALTAIRTGVAAALASHVLARPDADTAAVIGAGMQGRWQLRALAGLRRLRHVRAYDIEPARAHRFAEEMANELTIPVHAALSAETAIRGIGIALVATWSRRPFIMAGMVDAGTHVTALGADEPGKAELGADLFREAIVICDDRHLAVEAGALGGIGLGTEAVSAELGEVLAGAHPGRTSPDEITIYAGVGLAFQDTIAAWQVYRAARARGVGREVDFLW